MPDQPPRRHLPVLQTRDEPPPAAPEADRPAWHWVAFGTVATFLVWLPLAAIAEHLAAPAPFGPPTGGGWLLLSQALAFFTGAFAGGLLVGRLGGPAGRKEATLSGISAGALAWLITLSRGSPASSFEWGVFLLLVVILATIGGAAALLGGRLGLRLRPAPPAP